MNKRVYKNIIICVLLILSVLVFIACNNDIETNNSSSSNINTPQTDIGSASDTEKLHLYSPHVMDLTKPHVFSEMLISKDNPKLNTIDFTLSFPVYHDEYGSYFLAKRTGLYVPKTAYGLKYQNVGLEMEDGIIRYFPCKITYDAHYWFNLNKDIPLEEHGFEKVYFNGCMTNNELITTCYKIISTSKGGDINDIIYPYNGEGFVRIESSDGLLLKSEDEILEYLLTIDKYNNSQLIVTSFGKKALFNGETGIYTFLNDVVSYDTRFEVLETGPDIENTKATYIYGDSFDFFLIDIADGRIINRSS